MAGARARDQTLRNLLRQRSPCIRFRRGWRRSSLERLPKEPTRVLDQMMGPRRGQVDFTVPLFAEYLRDIQALESFE